MPLISHNQYQKFPTQQTAKQLQPLYQNISQSMPNIKSKLFLNLEHQVSIPHRVPIIKIGRKQGNTLDDY